jgi:hypothetical protein
MTALKTDEVLRAEAEAIHGRGPAPGVRSLNGLNSAALCLSGGGIRSAAFALGVIQAFAAHPRPDPSGFAPVDSANRSLLAKFHYLSTVSGGGYIMANAVRKIEIDLGVQIRFRGLEQLKRRPEDSSDIGAGHPYHAIGEIDYCSADRGEIDSRCENGFILYIKAGYHGCESAGIRGYARAHLDFPHQSTIDQWFSESQFESYRALGFEITDSILCRALAADDCAADPSFAKLFAAWYKESEKLVPVSAS